MPNYSLILDTKFKPFSYQEMLAPVAAATQAHQAVESDLANLKAMAGIWEKLADNAQDRDVYRQYRQYYDDVSSQIDKLMSQGLTPMSRRGLSDIRARYQSEIVPIEEAYKKREADIARQQQISDKTGGMTLFTRDARSTSLSDYMNGVTDFGQINLDKVMQEGMVAGKALSSKYIKSDMSNKYGAAYDVLTKQKGLSPYEATLALSGTKGYEDFSEFINSSLKKYNTDAYGDNSDKIREALLSGMNIGITYDVNEQLQKNSQYEQSLKTAAEKDLINYKYRLEHPDPVQTDYDFKTINDYAGIDKNKLNGQDYIELFGSKVQGSSGIRTTYFGGKKSKKGGREFVNPMKVYEEYQKELKKNHLSDTVSSIEAIHDTKYDYVSYDERRTEGIAKKISIKEKIKRQYGVDKIITSQQYKLMQDMGYTSKSNFQDFDRKSTFTRYNSLQKAYKPTDLNLSDYSQVEKGLFSYLSDMKDHKNILFNPKTGESEDISDVIKYDNNGNITNKLDRVGYSIKHPEQAIIYTRGKSHRVGLESFDPSLKEIIHDLLSPYYDTDGTLSKDLTSEEQSLLQKTVSKLIYDNLQKKNPVKPNTSKEI